MHKHYTYLANWKMNFTLNQALSFTSQHYDELVLLAKKPFRTIALCPSTEALHPVYQIIQGTAIALGAQDCSDHLRGACTGQISPESLFEVGCTFCIVGHSEQRAIGADSNERVAQKSVMLLDCGISPVICIGENEEQRKTNQVFETLKSQLKPVFEALTKTGAHSVPLFIAYEPIWAIGTGTTATTAQVEIILSWLYDETAKNSPDRSWKFLYGGSVKSTNSAQLKQISHLDGFLIGGSSLDFEEFEKIVNYDERVS